MGCGHRIAIAAGKGGVGKSTVAVHLAQALERLGGCIGILDADLYGPSLGKMLPQEEGLHLEEGGLIPAKGLGVHYVSLSQFAWGKKATLVRAPIANQIMGDFLQEVRWPSLDFLLIDFPPGTGDIHLTILQKMSLSGAILVTTPQEVALLDVAKAHEMFLAMGVPILGVVENMSFFQESETSVKLFPFGRGHVERFCLEKGLKRLIELPLDAEISHCCDKGLALGVENSSRRLFDKLAQDIQQVLMEVKAGG